MIQVESPGRTRISGRPPWPAARSLGVALAVGLWRRVRDHFGPVPWDVGHGGDCPCPECDGKRQDATAW